MWTCRVSSCIFIHSYSVHIDDFICVYCVHIHYILLPLVDVRGPLKTVLVEFALFIQISMGIHIYKENIVPIIIYTLGFQPALKQWVFWYNHHCLQTLRVLTIEIGEKTLFSWWWNPRVHMGHPKKVTHFPCGKNFRTGNGVGWIFSWCDFTAAGLWTPSGEVWEEVGFKIGCAWNLPRVTVVIWLFLKGGGNSNIF